MDTSDVWTYMQSPGHVKTPNSPGRAQKHAEEPERLRNHSGASSMRTHVHSDRIDTKPTVAIVESISTLPNRPKTPNSPIGANGRRIDEVGGGGMV